MIPIKQIELPFFGTIKQVEVIIPNYNLTANEVPLLKINLYSDADEFYKTIEQPIPSEIVDQWAIDNNYIIDWALEQNKIERLELK